MSKVNYEEMTNKELQTLIDDFELTVNPKTPGKPTKAELIATLNAYKTQQDIINGVEPEVIEDEEEEITEDEVTNTESVSEKVVAKIEKPKAAKEMSINERRQLQRADLMRKERVIIYDVRDTQTKVPAESFTWGNSLIGIHTDIVDLASGKPQYVRRGALANMRNTTFARSVQEEEFGPVVNKTEYRFNIKELDGLTEDEIDALAAKQRMMNAKGGF